MNFRGKAIYTPKGKAGEYAQWACNFFTGCSNDCEYCFCKRGVMSHAWDTAPHLKKCFTSERHAFNVFCRELDKCEDKIGSSGLLFSFTTDPLLPETRDLTFKAMEEAIFRGINVKILTKRVDWLDEFITRTEIQTILYGEGKHRIAFGFTLTGFDEKEPSASLTDERIEAMRELHDLGFKTFASIEPIITPAMSRNMIASTREFCDLYKVGIISGKGKNYYNRAHVEKLFEWLFKEATDCRIYLKDSFIDYLGISRDDLPPHFVSSSYNMFPENEK